MSQYPYPPMSLINYPEGGELPHQSSCLAGMPVPIQNLHDLRDPRPHLTLRDLEVVNCLGMGGFGSVVLVRVRKDLDCTSQSNPLFAVKTLKKSLIRSASITAKDELSAERRALSPLPWNPFISGIVSTFSDSQNLYLMLEVMPYGNFCALIDKLGPFEPLTACFYYCNIWCALEFIHSYDLVSRDLKPENILVGHDGYLCLTDFGLAEVAGQGGVWQFIGTSCYMCPELIKNLRYVGPTVDWWASGVILYEMLTKQMPFKGSTDEVIFANILSLNYCWPDVPLGNSIKHFISRLLAFRPENRLGFHGADEVANHPWLSHVDWIRMRSKTYEAPWIPDETELPNRWHQHPAPAKRDMGDLRIGVPPVHLRWDRRFRKKTT